MAMKKDKHRKIASAIKTAVGDYEDKGDGLINIEKTPKKEVIFNEQETKETISKSKQNIAVQNAQIQGKYQTETGASVKNNIVSSKTKETIQEQPTLQKQNVTVVKDTEEETATIVDATNEPVPKQKDEQNNDNSDLEETGSSEGEITKAVKEVDKIKGKMNVVQDSMDSLNKKLDDMEENISNLVAVYELVTNQINPFIDKTQIATQQKQEPIKKEIQEEIGLIPAQNKKTEKEIELEEEPIIKDEKIPKIIKEIQEKKIETKPLMKMNIEPEVPVQTIKSNLKGHGELLNTIDRTDIRKIEEVLDWLEFLIEHVGKNEIPRILEYYRNVGWISEKARNELMEYAEGIEADQASENKGKKGLTIQEQKKSLELFYKIIG